MVLHLSTLASAAVTTKTQTTYLGGASPAPWLVGPPENKQRLDSADRDQTLAEYLEWSYDHVKTQDMASKTLAAVRWALPNLSQPMSRSFPSAIACLQGCRRLEPGSSRPPVRRVLVLLVACRTSFWSRGQVVTAHPRERARAAWKNKRVRHQRLAGLGKTSVHVSRPAVSQRHTRRKTAPFSLLVHASDKGNGKCVGTAPLSATANHAVLPLRHGGASEDRAVKLQKEEMQKCGGWKRFNSVRRYEKHTRLSLVMSKIPPELLPQANATWNDSAKGFDTCAHWIHSQGRSSFPLHFQRSPFCWHNFERSRQCSSLFGSFPRTGV